MSDVKLLRKQLRNVVQDILPDLLKSELGNAIHKELATAINARLDGAIRDIQGVLTQIDQRSKDVQGYLVRQTLKPVPAAVTGEQQNESKEVSGS